MVRYPEAPYHRTRTGNGRLTSCLCTDALLAEVQNMSKVFGNFVRAAETQVSLFECICIIIARASI